MALPRSNLVGLSIYHGSGMPTVLSLSWPYLVESAKFGCSWWLVSFSSSYFLFESVKVCSKLLM